MDEKKSSALRVDKEHFRTADMVIGVVLLLAGVLGGYFAIVDGVRDYWLLLVVGIIGGVLMLRRARGTNSAS